MARDDLLARLERLQLENEQLVGTVQAMEETRSRYADLFQLAPVPYLTLDAAGAIHEANQAALALLALPAGGGGNHLVGRRLRSLLRVEDLRTLAGHLRRCRQTSEVVTSEVRLKDGTPLALWSRPATSSSLLYPTMLVDLRERDRAEEEVQRSLLSERKAREESAAKDVFIATLSHELRTPLTPVLAAVSAERNREEVPPSLRPVWEMIRRNILLEARLIDDSLDVTRIARGKLSLDRRPLDVHEVVRDVLETLKSEIEGKGLVVSENLAASNHVVLADPIRLRQVVWNILRNAIRYTDRGGQIAFRSWNDDRRLSVEVSDNGVGFEPALAAALFEPFEQISRTSDPHGGLGLGLAISKGVMDLHGGRISANSQGPGLGARFVIDLDAVDDVPVPLEALAAPAIPRGAEKAGALTKKKILLVDDHPDTAEVLAEVLVDIGYEVRVAQSAEAALEGDLEDLDLVVSDIGLPKANGLELMRQIRARRSHRPIRGVAMSGYGSESDVRASRDAGFTAHLTKPVDFARLLAAIQEAERTAD